MPRFDGTGPMGQGARSGRGMGRCADSNSDRVNETMPMRGMGMGRGGGRGMGRGGGRGMGRGGASGMGRRMGRFGANENL